MRNLPHTEHTLLIRTDFSDEAAWQSLRTAVTTPDEEDLLNVADKEALTGTEMPLPALCMSGEDKGGEEPRFDELQVVAQQLWSIENNISLANMDWEEFVDAADDDLRDTCTTHHGW